MKLETTFTDAHRESILDSMRREAPPEFREWASKFELTEAIQVVEHYLPALYAEGRVLILISRPGLGKTFSEWYARYATRYLQERPESWRKSKYGSPSAFVSAPDVLAASIEDKETYSELRELNGLLIIDDLGADYGSEWRDSVLDRLIDYRYLNRLPTMISTNLGKEAFNKMVGERCASRFEGWGWYYALQGDDRRKKQTVNRYPLAEAVAVYNPTGEL